MLYELGAATYHDPIEEVADGEQCSQDVLEGPVTPQVLYTLLEICQRLYYFLYTHTTLSSSYSKYNW